MDYNSIMIENFIPNLIKAREKKGLTAYELSLRIGKDETYINKIETGNCYPSIPVVFDILEVLEIEANDLIN